MVNAVYCSNRWGRLPCPAVDTKPTLTHRRLTRITRPAVGHDGRTNLKDNRRNLPIDVADTEEKKRILREAMGL